MSLRQLFHQTLITIDELRNAVREVCSSNDRRTRGSAQTVLEQRVMLSASPLPVVDAQPETASSLGDVADAPSDAIVWQDSDVVDTQQIPADVSEQGFREIVFLDTRLESLEEFERSALHGDLDDHVRLVMLETDRDGIEQITETLAKYSGIEAIHIVSHGGNGRIQLGGSVVSATNLDGYAGQIAGWQSALSSDADILFYGCNLAADEEGKLLVDSIAALTDADLAASDDVTGHEDLGGDWDFEYFAGVVETEGVFSMAVQQNWYGTLDITSDLVGHYTFDEGSGVTAGDSSLTGNDGSLLDSPTWTSGKIGSGALDFSGDFDRVEAADIGALDFTGDFSVSFWFNSTQTPGATARLVGQSSGSDGFVIFTDSFGDINWTVNGDGGSTTFWTAAPLDGAWHMVTAVRSGDDFELFIDGASAATDTTAVGTVSSTEPLRFGSSTATTSDYDGLLDDVRIYDRALSTSDITQLYDHAGTLAVDTTNDVLDGVTTDVATLLSNKGADGFISLREAIQAINNDSGGWSIDLGPGNYGLSLTGLWEDGAATGDLDITGDITILGDGAGSTTISGAGISDRIFDVKGTGSLTLDSLTVANANTTSIAGGGVFSAGSFTATNVVFDSLAVTSADGGGVYIDSGTAEVTWSAFINNSATNGGALSTNGGTTSLTNVTISGNSSVYNGAGIEALGGTLNLEHVTIANNVITNVGGGGGLFSNGATVNMQYSIVANNTAVNPEDDVDGTIVSGGYNIIEDAVGVTGTVGSDTTGSDGGISALSMVGGTYVHTITPMSGAFNAATGSAITHDQRGEIRDANPDIGAFEWMASAPSDPPTDLSSGIGLNTDGGNDAYFVDATSGVPYWDGFEAITMEFQVSDLGTPSVMSTFYSKKAASSESFFGVEADGQLNWSGFTSSGTYSQLFDGGFHSVAFSWRAQVGDLRFYVDGDLVEVVTTPTQSQTNGGGVFVVGQEQDSVGGGYDASESFSGVFHDLRIWDHARATEEISLHWRQKLDVTPAEAASMGLVANWQMDGFNGSNEVVDVVSGNNLSIGHASGAGFVSSTPTENLHVVENASNGTSVGYVVPTDSEASSDAVSDGLFLASGNAADQYGVTGTFGDWTVTSGSVDLFAQSSWPSRLGGRLVNLDGGSPGTIEQTFATQANRQYQVIFSLSGDFSGGEAVKDLRVSAGGLSDDFSISQSSNWSWGSTNALETRSFTFVASSTSTTLAFASLEGPASQYGPYIGDIRVVEVPSAINTILSNDSTLRYDAATGKFYRVVDASVDFTSALSNAVGDGLNGVSGQLLTIYSNYENELARQFALDSGKEIWLGTHDTNNDGNWNWLEGTTESSDQFWTGGAAGSSANGYFAPAFNQSEGASEEYARLLVSGQWADDTVGGSHAYIVEWDADEVLSGFTFSLTDDAGGRFAIDNSTGEITVADGSQLDYEAATSHNVTVEVTDAAGNTYSEAMTIAVDNVNEDSDGDGLWDDEEDANTDADNNAGTNPTDTDGDTIPDYLDTDDDGDGIATALENADPNADGDPRDAFDSDRDGQPDYLDAPTGVTDGVVVDEQKISDSQGGLTATLDDGDLFGRSVAPIGDLDGDGTIDLVVGAPADDDGGTDRGAVYVLFMNPDGTVKAEQKISDTEGGLSTTLDDWGGFGRSVAMIGDVDGDGVADLAVGTPFDNDGGSSRGAVFVLFLNADGTVKAEQKISDTTGSLAAVIDNGDSFGWSVSGLGDVDGDGVSDIVVGAAFDDDGGTDRGAAYVLFLNADGTVKAEQKISDTAGAFGGVLDDSDYIGWSVSGLGDVDGDGVNDLVVGASDDDGGTDRGAVYVMFLNADGTVKAEQKISSTQGGLTGPLDDSDFFGRASSGVGDLDNDGVSDLVVGAFGDDDGGDAGAVYVLYLNADGTVKSEQKISMTQGGLTGPLDPGDNFGLAVTGIGDLDGDGTMNLVVGAQQDDDGGSNRGAVYVLDLAATDLSPTQTIPIGQTINEDETLVFSTANGNAITVSDETASDARIQVTLEVTNGTLRTNNFGGYVWVQGTNGSSLMTLEGTESAINAALEDLTYTPNADYNGSDNLVVTTALHADQEGYYTFEGGNADDQSASAANDGTLAGTATITIDPERGEVLDLSGAGDYVQINGLFNEPSDVTLAAWVNLTTAGTNGSEVISLGDSFSLRLDQVDTSALRTFWYNGSTWELLDFGGLLAGTGWHHVAATFSDSTDTATLYLDGVAVASTTTTDSISYTLGSDTTIGTHGNGDTLYAFDGMIDDARVYNRALSVDEIAAIAADEFSVSDTVNITINALNDAPYFSDKTNADVQQISLPDVKAVTSTDLDNDGDTDLIATTDTGSLYWYENDGTGSFGSGNLVASAQNFRAVEVYDLEGDGDMDIVAMNDDPADAGDSVYVLTNQFIGSGAVSFSATSFEGSVGGDSDGGRDLAIGDIDGDGRADIVGTFYRSIGDSQVVVFEQNSVGVWTKTLSDAVGNAYGIDLADMDGDGDLDIVAGEFQNKEIRWYENDGAATAGFTRQVIYADNDLFPVDLRVSDFDGDGDQDIVYADWGSSDAVVILLNDGAVNPTFTHQSLYTATSGLLYHLDVADMNGDGHDDLIVTNKNTSSAVADVLVFHNDGSANFTQTQIDDNASNVEWAEAADLSGDGKLDIIAAPTTTNAIEIYQGHDDGFVVARVNEDLAYGGLHLEVADDAGAGLLEVAINVVNGRILLPTGSVTVLSGSSATSAVTFEGTVADINTALNSFTFMPDTDFNGLGDIQVTVDDRGNTGSGGVKTVSETLYVEVRAVNDAPVATAPAGPLSATEQVWMNFEGTGFSISDVDDLGGTLTATLTANQGAVSVTVGDSGVSIVSGNGTGSLVVSGTKTQLNALLTGAGTGTLQFRHPSNSPPASTTLTLTVNDQGNTGTDPGLTGDGTSEEDSATVTVNITAVNDNPNADGGGPYSINEGDTLSLDASGTTDVDSASFTYRWDLDNDGQYDDLVTTSATANVAWSTLYGLGVDDDGIYTIGLQVDDGGGGLATDSTSVTIANVDPTLTASGSATAGGGQVYTLTLTDVDPGNDSITSWIVNWGDGSIDTFAGDPSSVTHTYANDLAGLTLDITVSAVDEDGQYFESNMLVPAYGGDYVNTYDGPNGTFVDSFAPSSDGILGHASIVLMPTGNYLVSGVDSGNILEYQPDGTLVGDFVAASDPNLSNPGGLAYGPDGNLYVADYGAGKILRFNGTTGAYIDDFVATGLTSPLGLEFGPDGNLYVANRGSAGVLRYDGTTGAYDASFSVSSISGAEDLTFGPDGNIYVGSASGVIRVDATTGATSTFIANGTGGLGLAAGIDFGPDGHLYVADQNNDVIRVYDSSTGGYIEDYAAGVVGPAYMDFTADHRVTVTNSNQSPTIATNTGTTVDEGSTANTITPAMLNEGDPDDDGVGLTYTITADVSNGTLKRNGSAIGLNDTFTQQDIDDNLLTYDHDGSETTSDSFDFSLADGGENSSTPATGTFSITVTGVNDAPTTTPVTLVAIAEDSGARTITQAELLANANDVDGDSLTATGLAINTSLGSLVDNGDGTWDYTPAGDDDASVSFTYTITDGTANVAGSASLDITPVNDAPTTAPVTLVAIAEDSGARTITQAELLANANDVDGDSLTATGLAINSGLGTLVDNGDGTWDFTPATNDDTSVLFTYTITDGPANVAGSASLDITPVNDAPVLSDGIATTNTEGTISVPFATSTVDDVDSLDFDGGTMTVAITSGGRLEDFLQLGSGNGVTRSGADLYVDGVLVGTWTGGGSGTPLTVNFNSDATLPRVQKVYQGITFRTNTDNPVFGVRTLSVSMTDGDGQTSNTATGTVDVDTAQNDNPVFTALDGTPTYVEGGSAVVLDADVGVSDPELDYVNSGNGNYSGSSLTIVRNGGASTDDVFGFNDGSGITLSGGNLIKNSQVIATFDTTTTAGELVITFADAGGEVPTSTDVDSILRQVTYANSSDTPPAIVQIDWTFDDGGDSVTTQGLPGARQTSGSTTVNITPANDAPTTTPVTLTPIAEDSGARTITQAELLANANDVDGDPLTATGLAINTGLGSLVDNGDGTWDYTPAGDDDASVSFTYTITDGTANVAGSASLDITPVNDAPTTAPVTLVAITEDSGARTITQAELLANANDVDGDSLTATGLAINTGLGSLVDNGDGTWDYTPAGDDDTSVNFTYTITDGTANVAGSASLDITPVNDAPTTAPVTLVAIAEDSGARTITQAELLANANDVDGDSLTATGLAINTALGSLVDNGDGTWDYTPAADDDTSVSFTYTITDGTANVAGSASLDITPVNDAPTTAPVTLVAIAEDSGARTITQAELLANANDVDGDSLTATGLAINTALGSLVDNGDGTWDYTPAADDDTSVSFTYTITDGTANVAGSASLDITPVNDAPTTAPVTLVAIAEDSGARTITQAELLANASDVDGDSLTATGLAINTGLGSLVDNGDGTWDYTPAAGDDTSVSFTYTITDGTASVAGSASLDITPVNDAPTTAPVTLVAIAEDSGARTITQAELLASANDVDGDPLTATGLAINTGLGSLVDNGDGTWDYTPAGDDDTSVTFTYTITDGTANVAGSASLDITPVNDAPTTAPVTLVAIAEDSGARTITQAELLANANDVDGDSLTATGLAINTGLGSLVDNGDGTWDYTPAGDDDASVSFTYTITDGTANVAGTASLDITAVNDAPTTAPVTLVAIAEDSGARTITQAELLANANDVDGDSLTATGLAINTGLGSLVDNGDGTWDYIPAGDDDASVSFTYTITDGTANVASSASLDITPVNDAPTAAPVSLVAIAEDSGARTITQAELLANANDVDGDSLTATGLAINTGLGSLVDNGDGTWDYTPAGDDDTSVSFTYTITDGTANVAGTASLDITPVNDAPTTAPVTLVTIAEDSGARTITQAELLASANDVDGDSLTATGLAIDTGLGSLVDNGDGTWDYTPAGDDDASVGFTYTITDGTANTAATASLDITLVNDAPTTTPVTLVAIAEDSGARTITQAELLANASDVDGDALTATGLAINSGLGTLVDNGDGTWDYTPASDDDTSVSFTYTITDGAANVAGTASLDITPVNDAPRISLSSVVASVAENSDTSAPMLVADITVLDDNLGTNSLALLGPDAGSFALIGNGLYVRPGTVLDFETNEVLDVTVAVNDPTVGGSPDGTVSHVLHLTDVNEAATVVVTKLVDSVPEDADTTSSRKVGDITIVDDALGANILTLTGDDSGWFEIVYGATGHAELHLIAGAPLNFQLTPHLDVTVEVVDVTLPIPPASAALSLDVSEVFVGPGSEGDHSDSGLPVDSEDDEREDSGSDVPHVPYVSTTTTQSPTPAAESGPDGRGVTAEADSTVDTSVELVESIHERSPTLLGSTSFTVYLKSPRTMELEVERLPESRMTRLRIDAITREVLSLVPFHGSREVSIELPSKPSSEQLIVGSTAVFASTLSVGYVIWVLRSGSILASLLATLPSWMAFDPLPILSSFEEENENGESLLNVVDGT